eukprot:TRINITY_DN6187_c0_g1_i2.p2 TRINITY_DN6187_c0_g1~~TRINITY_DN6187_c0_g1_i2.p2  ORF type:complete len:257 (+),score=41.52 TRINITY_DN6187_c0_g1_i2:1418-2188(+)
MSKAFPQRFAFCCAGWRRPPAPPSGAPPPRPRGGRRPQMENLKKGSSFSDTRQWVGQSSVVEGGYIPGNLRQIDWGRSNIRCLCDPAMYEYVKCMNTTGAAHKTAEEDPLQGAMAQNFGSKFLAIKLSQLGEQKADQRDDPHNLRSLTGHGAEKGTEGDQCESYREQYWKCKAQYRSAPMPPSYDDPADNPKCVDYKKRFRQCMTKWQNQTQRCLPEVELLQRSGCDRGAMGLGAPTLGGEDGVPQRPFPALASGR